MITEPIPFRRKAANFFDWTTFLITIMLVAAGLISIYSATFGSPLEATFQRQLFTGGVGFAVMIIIMFIPENWLRLSSYLVYGTSLVLLVLVLVMGTVINGTKGWLNLGGFSFQPSELAKLGTLMISANYLSRKGTDIRTIIDLGVIALFVAIPTGLIVMQPDIGSASVMGALLFGILFWAGFDSLTLFTVVSLPVIMLLSFKSREIAYIAVGVLSLIAVTFRKRIWITALVIGVFIMVSFSGQIIYDNMMDHQQQRIETFVNPAANPRGAGYNVIQSLMAVGSGGLFGKGYLQGTQTQLRYIPMQWTDFIYSVPTEEFGFIGGMLVLLLIIGLIWRAIKISNDTDSKFFSLMAMGAAFIFLYHTIINVGMVIGLTPVMGIPLPFMSYGGTAIVVNLALIGFMLNAYRKKQIKRYA